MRRSKLVLIADVEIEDGKDAQDLADLYHQALNTVNETIVCDFILFEHNKNEESLNEFLDELKLEFEYGDLRDFGQMIK